MVSCTWGLLSPRWSIQVADFVPVANTALKDNFGLECRKAWTLGFHRDVCMQYPSDSFQSTLLTWALTYGDYFQGSVDPQNPALGLLRED